MNKAFKITIRLRRASEKHTDTHRRDTKKEKQKVKSKKWRNREKIQKKIFKKLPKRELKKMFGETLTGRNQSIGFNSCTDTHSLNVRSLSLRISREENHLLPRVETRAHTHTHTHILKVYLFLTIKLHSSKRRQHSTNNHDNDELFEKNEQYLGDPRSFHRIRLVYIFLLSWHPATTWTTYAFQDQRTNWTIS